MKCNAVLVFKKTGKLAFSVPSSGNVNRYLDTFTPKQKEKLDLNSIQTCGGKIVASIGCHDEPFYGGTSAEIDIEFVCEKCKMNYFPELPRTLDSLNEWITRKIEEQ